MVTIVDFGMGNLRSIQHKMLRMGIECAVSSEPAEVARAEVLVLPGVGHFARGMANLRHLGLIELLHQKVMAEKTPVMGICLGMQLFSKWSEEGEVEGLGWIDAVTRRFRFDGALAHLKIPHVGWNEIRPVRASPLLDSIESRQRFYFTHSYHVVCSNQADVLATTSYGYDFVSCVEQGHLFGTQFHPEKSHRRGMELVRNFVRRAARLAGSGQATS